MTSPVPLATLADVVNHEFDYIICGGGTAGLTLAARLSSDPDISVLVLEAGAANLHDPAILVPAQYFRQIGDQRYDWMFSTSPQRYCNDKQYFWSRGKSLGGSSAASFMAYVRPPAEDIDAWEELGNPGWNWSNFLKYSKRGERLTAPTTEQASLFRQTYEPEYHGTDGELEVGFPSLIFAGEVPFQDTLNHIGIQTVKDPLSGNVNGTWMTPLTIDPKTKTRSYATTAFYLPNADRPNLQVLTTAHVNRIVSAPANSHSGDDFTADAVEFEYCGQVHSVKVKKEVILCAGAIKSPQILELSGIGCPEILEPLGVECCVSLPGVGSNAQEHILFGVAFELDPRTYWDTLDKLKDPEVAAAQMKLFETQKGLHTMGLAGLTYIPLQQISPHAGVLVSAESTKLERDHKEGRISDGLWEQYRIQLRMLKSDTSVDVEVITFPQFLSYVSLPEAEKAYMTITAALNHPFSRGTIHIASTDPQQHPICDPHYFEDDIDMQLLVEGLKFIRKCSETEPFKSMILKEVDPGLSTQTDDEMREYIKNALTTVFRKPSLIATSRVLRAEKDTCGTCSMLPREKGGVVDPKLKVYGTTNVRVVDLSIVPLHVAAHTQATVYAIAEQAADIIKGQE